MKHKCYIYTNVIIKLSVKFREIVNMAVILSRYAEPFSVTRLVG